MTNRNIDLPSQRALIVNEIEAPLRREFRTRKNRSWLWAIIGMLIATGTYFAVSYWVNYEAAQDAMVQKAIAAENQPLCRQYLNDSKLNGTAAEETLNKICHD